jgi:toxin YoeB
LAVPGREARSRRQFVRFAARLALAKKKADRDAVFQPEFREDLRYWVDTDRRIAVRIFDLIEAIMRDPFAGIGRPEPLRHLAPNTWSRRVTQEHRLVYLVSRDRIDFLQARYHY